MKARSGPAIALAALCLIWGYGWIVMKWGLEHAHPFDFAATRLVIATVLLFAILAATGRPLTLPRYGTAIVLGLVQVASFIILSHFALLYTGAGRTSVLTYTMPFWMLLFAWMMLGERVRGAQWACIGLGAAGLVLVIAPWQLDSLEGSLLAVGSGAVWALGSVISKRWPLEGTDPLGYTAWQLAFGTVPLVLFALFSTYEPTRWSIEYGVILAYATLFATAGGWWLWTYVLAHMPAGISGLNTLAIPVIAVVAAWVHLDEQPGPRELAGMALIAVALGMLAALRLRRR